MAFNGHKTIMLQKQYLYVKASKGFQLVGTSTERIWTNTGYYRFLVENVAKSIGNSYVTIDYDNTDTEFLAYCSDLFLEEVQNSVVAAVENINDSLDDFADQNHDDIGNLASGLATLIDTLAKDSNLTNILSGLLGIATPSSSINILSYVGKIKEALVGNINPGSTSNIYNLVAGFKQGLHMEFGQFQSLNNGSFSPSSSGATYIIQAKQGVTVSAVSGSFMICDSFGNFEYCSSDFVIPVTGVYSVRKF